MVEAIDRYDIDSSSTFTLFISSHLPILPIFRAEPTSGGPPTYLPTYPHLSSSAKDQAWSSLR